MNDLEYGDDMRANYDNDGVNFGENPIWGNFQTSTRSPLSLFSSFDDDICLK